MLSARMILQDLLRHVAGKDSEEVLQTVSVLTSHQQMNVRRANSVFVNLHVKLFGVNFCDTFDVAFVPFERTLSFRDF